MNFKKPNIIFMGTAGFGIPTLDLINKNYNLKAIITNYDKPSGRGLKIKNSPVKDYAIKNNISFYQPKNLKNLDFIEVIKDLNPDFIIVVAFRMIPESIWKIPKFGTINLHASLLPNYRGSAPINWVLINNENQTGITSFFIDENIDTGDILFQQKIKIDERINAGDLHDKLQYLAAEVTEKTIDGILKNKLKPVKQVTISNLKTAYKFDKKNIQIDWDNDALSIYNKIRGLDPFPGARTTLYLKLENEEKKLLIYKSDYIVEKHNNKTGNVIVSDGVLKISCNNGYVIIKELKVEGKKKMKTRDLLNGFRISDNSYVK
tara:strand:+ start:859 stop:1815 length:957 start_codon:yes stop_codon:yes gene_type:complete